MINRAWQEKFNSSTDPDNQKINLKKMNYIGLPNNYLREEATLHFVPATRMYEKHLSSLPVIKALFEVEVDRVYSDKEITLRHQLHVVMKAGEAEIDQWWDIPFDTVKYLVPKSVRIVAVKKVWEDNEASTNKGGYYYDLFKFFSEQHDLTLLDSDIQDIIHAVDDFQKKNQ